MKLSRKSGLNNLGDSSGVKEWFTAEQSQKLNALEIHSKAERGNLLRIQERTASRKSREYLRAARGTLQQLVLIGIKFNLPRSTGGKKSMNSSVLCSILP